MIVDCCLNNNVLKILKGTLSEVEHFNRFKRALTKAVEKKLEGLKNDSINRIITSKELFSENSMSFLVNEFQNEVQESFIRNLVKVAVHHEDSSEFCGITDYQENLLALLCIDRLFIEKIIQYQCVGTHLNGTSKEIQNILESDTSSMSHKMEKRETKPDIHLYINIDCESINHTSQISNKLDKFDLQDYTSDGCNDSILLNDDYLVSQLPISKETMNQARIHLLPSKELDCSWECLYLEGNIKQKLFSYATISLKVSQFFEDSYSIMTNNNKLLIIHGPPGTGKTTICKALCQKLAIRNISNNSTEMIDNQTYSAILIEISCSRVFSRWFGESSKNLENIFKDVEILLKENESKNKFICLLIDEMETIAFSRSKLIDKNETTDAIRVVNTLLTKLDQLKKYKNLLVIGTSNLTDSMDPAFLDRADGIFHIGNPSKIGCFEILNSAIKELIKVGIIKSNEGINITKESEYKTSINILSKMLAVCRKRIFVSFLFD